MQSKKNPRILIITPEVAFLPKGMGAMDNYSIRAGGLADVTATLVDALYSLGVDVHIAMPYYRKIFEKSNIALQEQDLSTITKRKTEERIHLADDREFYYLENVYSGYAPQDIKIFLSFQRELINNIIPKVAPDIIHCNDWMTGLIPAMTRKFNIPCLFTIHNFHSMRTTMAHIEDCGIDAASFWNHLYFREHPKSYEYCRNNVLVDLLTSGVFAAHYVNTVSPSFLNELIEGKHNIAEPYLREELWHKVNAGCGFGILNAPSPKFDPSKDKQIPFNYNASNFKTFKAKNKTTLQKKLGLEIDEKAPLFFWPSRLDPVQKGCQIFANILYDIVSSYWGDKLQVVFVANGEYKKHFRDIVSFHNLHNRIAVCDFYDDLSHQSFAASDFILIPSSFEPCGLPQMIGAIYGSLPIVHNTGGLKDTISHIDLEKKVGNGFVFNNHDSYALRWAIDRAMDFYKLPEKIKNTHIKRIMTESLDDFSHTKFAKKYISLYQKMLDRPLL